MNSFKAFFTCTLLHIALTATLDQIDYQTENRGINSLTNLLSQNATLSTSELERAVEKSYWNLAAKMIQEYYNPNHIDYSQNLVKCKKKLKRTQNAEFEKLTSLMPLDFPTIQKVAPAFLWGQNMTFLLVKIKFSARLDLPGSLEVQNLNITFDYDRFIFSALSFEQSDFAIHYYLEIETFHHLNTHFCQWKYDSVGTVYLEMMKSPAPYFWRNIFIDQHKKLPNQYMWWDVYLNYMEDFNSYGANALLLFDQRELERERKEEKEEFLEKMKKRDARLQRKRDAKIQTESIQALRNKMYCWFTYQNQKHPVLTVHDWEAWQY